MRNGVSLAMDVLQDALDTMEEADAMEVEGVIAYLNGEEFAAGLRQARKDSNYSNRWRRGFLSAHTPRLDK